MGANVPQRMLDRSVSLTLRPLPPACPNPNPNPNANPNQVNSALPLYQRGPAHKELK